VRVGSGVGSPTAGSSAALAVGGGTNGEDGWFALGAKRNGTVSVFRAAAIVGEESEASAAPVQVLPSAGSGVTSLSWAPASLALASATASTVCVWNDALHSRSMTRLADGSGAFVTFSPVDGNICATGSARGIGDKTPMIRIFDLRVSPRKPRMQLSGYAAAQALSSRFVGEERARWKVSQFYSLASIVMGCQEIHVWDLRVPHVPTRELKHPRLQSSSSPTSPTGTQCRDGLIDMDWTRGPEQELISLDRNGMICIWDVSSPQKGPPRAKRMVNGSGRGPHASRMIQCIGRRGLLVSVERDPSSCIRLYNSSDIDMIGNVAPSVNGPVQDFDVIFGPTVATMWVYALFKNSVVRRFGFHEDLERNLSRSLCLSDDNEGTSSELSDGTNALSLSVSPVQWPITFLPERATQSQPASYQDDSVTWRASQSYQAHSSFALAAAKALAKKHASSVHGGEVFRETPRKNMRTSSFLGNSRSVMELVPSGREVGLCFSPEGHVMYFINRGNRFETSRSAVSLFDPGTCNQYSVDGISDDEQLIQYRSPSVLSRSYPESDDSDLLFDMESNTSKMRDPASELMKRAFVVTRRLPDPVLLPSLLRRYELLRRPQGQKDIIVEMYQACQRNMDLAVSAQQTSVAQFWRVALAALEFPGCFRSPFTQLLLLQLVTKYSESPRFFGHEMVDALTCVLAAAACQEEDEQEDAQCEASENSLHILPLEQTPLALSFMTLVIRRGQRIRQGWRFDRYVPLLGKKVHSRSRSRASSRAGRPPAGIGS